MVSQCKVFCTKTTATPSPAIELQGQTAERVLIHVDTGKHGAEDLLNHRMAYILSFTAGSGDAQIFT